MRRGYWRRYTKMQPPLETPEQAAAARENFYRAAGGCICSVCEHEYWRHPQDDPDEWLHILCNGDRVHL